MWRENVFFVKIISAEMKGYLILANISTNSHTMSFTNKNISLPDIQRGYFEKPFQDSTFYVPPPIEIYTMFSLQEYFLTFLGILFLQCIIIFVSDKFFVKGIPQNTTWWERVIHAIGKSNIPYPFVYWHEG